jgi:inhibitor of the pro-sigma K processing machinery
MGQGGMDMFEQIALILVALFAIVLLLRLITAPIRLGYKILINLAAGYALLFLFNLLASLAGFVIDLNLISAALVGLFGLPGLAMLLVMRFILL